LPANAWGVTCRRNGGEPAAAHGKGFSVVAKVPSVNWPPTSLAVSSAACAWSWLSGPAEEPGAVVDPPGAVEVGGASVAENVSTDGDGLRNGLPEVVLEHPDSTTVAAAAAHRIRGTARLRWLGRALDSACRTTAR